MRAVRITAFKSVFSFSDISKIHGEDEDEDVMKKIDKIYTDCPFYGSRRIKEALLRYHSLIVNRKKIQRLMKIMGIYGQSPGIMTSRRCQKHKKYPYLLRYLDINRPCMAWCSDITYLPIDQGHVYLVAIMDWYSRYIIAWELSNTLDNEFCLQALGSLLLLQSRIFSTLTKDASLPVKHL